MSALDVLAALLFVAPIPGWSSTVILVAVALRKPRIAALTERAIAAVILSFVATIAAILGFARLGRVPVDRDIALLALAIICIGVSAPAVVWLWQFVRGAFGGPER